MRQYSVKDVPTNLCSPPNLSASPNILLFDHTRADHGVKGLQDEGNTVPRVREDIEVLENVYRNMVGDHGEVRAGSSPCTPTLSPYNNYQ